MKAAEVEAGNAQVRIGGPEDVNDGSEEEDCGYGDEYPATFTEINGGEIDRQNDVVLPVVAIVDIRGKTVVIS